MEEVRTKRSTKGMWIAISIVLATLLACAVVGLFVNTNRMNSYGSSLEQVYQRTYYDFEEDVNNVEVKMGKLMAASSGSYQKKLIKEISSNAKSAQNNISILPISTTGLDDSIKFINQFYGYMSSLETKLETSNKLDSSDKAKLNELYETIKELKYNLGDFTRKLEGGYSFLTASKNIDGGFNNLTKDLQQVKTQDMEYPSMIYDGPFSDSVLNKEIKGLDGENVDSMQAEEELKKIFGENLKNFKYLGQTKGKFATHDFSFYLGGVNQFAQITEKGGKLLTLSAGGGEASSSIDYEQAKAIALKFASSCGFNNLEVVWSDEKEGEAYFNLAPVVKSVTLYPDLVKIKVDKGAGIVTGFEASTYYTNHTSRNISPAVISSEQAKNKIENGYNIQTAKLCLAPLDYNREVLCYEFKCNHMGSIYYIYINAQSGIEENILQVVKTDSGQKLL